MQQHSAYYQTLTGGPWGGRGTVGTIDATHETGETDSRDDDGTRGGVNISISVARAARDSPAMTSDLLAPPHVTPTRESGRAYQRATVRL